MTKNKSGFKTKPLSNFRTAVESTEDVKTGFCPGLTALSSHSSKVKVSNKLNLCGSIDIDTCTRDLYPSENRWDYAFCYNGKVYFIEVHSAESSEVSTVIRKLEWLKRWLVERAPQINALKVKDEVAYYWIQSKRFRIPQTTPQFKLAIKHKIKPIKELHL